MKNIYAKLLYIPLVFSMLTPAWGQEELGAILKKLLEENGKTYLNPLATAFGTGLNSGTFHRAKPHNILGFDVTLNVALIGIPEADTEFEFILPDDPLQFNVDLSGLNVPISLALTEVYESGITAPTFFGSKEQGSIPVNTTGVRATIISKVATASGQPESTVEALAGTQIDAFVANMAPFPTTSGIDLPLWATLMPQASLGLPFNLELTLRGFSTTTKAGDPIKFGGFGGKIGLSEFIPLFPIDFSVGWYATTVNLADIVTGSNSILTLQASKSIPVITLYGGIGLESSNLSAKYDVDLGGGSLETISFDLEGKNKTRTTVGLRLKFLLLTLQVDYNIGEYNAVNAGLSLTFR